MGHLLNTKFSPRAKNYRLPNRGLGLELSIPPTKSDGEGNTEHVTKIQESVKNDLGRRIRHSGADRTPAE
ncbi:MAG: hypothetical protein CBC13_11525 [Planctomycetia bacterium TMED53]|nr:MAG: hypothetical protein CBC13_11525 [Planctomycetia bacterium TMED53]